MSAISHPKKKLDGFFLFVAVTLFALSFLTFYKARDAERSGIRGFPGRGFVTVGQAYVFAGACFLGGTYCLVVGFRRKSAAPKSDQTANDI